jgi:hypothetical protein
MFIIRYFPIYFAPIFHYTLLSTVIHSPLQIMA